MRSSKQRSRSKSNRNRPTGGNIINRVFDSSGPEGKVRGTPQQIIDKYNQLARDAQLSNDRVATENFQQHSEHYTRMLAEATREMDTRRDQQDQQQRDRQQADQQRERQPERAGDRQSDRQSDRQPGGYQNGSAPDDDDNAARPVASDQPPSRRRGRVEDDDGNDPNGNGRHDNDPARAEPYLDEREVPRQSAQARADAQAAARAADNDPRDGGDSGLVDTPESKPVRARRPRKPRVRPDDAGSDNDSADGGGRAGNTGGDAGNGGARAARAERDTPKDAAE